MQGIYPITILDIIYVQTKILERRFKRIVKIIKLLVDVESLLTINIIHRNKEERIFQAIDKMNEPPLPSSRFSIRRKTFPLIYLQADFTYLERTRKMIRMAHRESFEGSSLSWEIIGFTWLVHRSSPTHFQKRLWKLTLNRILCSQAPTDPVIGHTPQACLLPRSFIATGLSEWALHLPWSQSAIWFFVFFARLSRGGDFVHRSFGVRAHLAFVLKAFPLTTPPKRN